MTDADFCNYKQIEDVIDDRKRLGLYNVSSRGFRGKKVKFDVDRDLGLRNVGRTDSEVTIVRVKRSGAVTKRKLNLRWDMDDVAIPGDGTHLGESPSLVNLATLVAQNLQCEGDDEYLVPLSSWEPFVKPDEALPDAKSSSETKLSEKGLLWGSSTDPNIPCRLDNSEENLETFLRKHSLGTPGASGGEKPKLAPNKN